MPPNLDDLAETRSLLLPAYGFTKAVPEGAFVPGPGFHIGPVTGPDDVFGALRRDEWHVAPRGTANFLYGASALFNDAIGLHAQRRHIRLRETDETAPDGTTNVCLMVEGLRTCVRRTPEASELIPGYAAWDALEGDLTWISSIVEHGPDRQKPAVKNVLFGRTGACALYAPLPEGGARVMLLSCRILDHDEEKPDLLQIHACASTVPSAAYPELTPDGKPLGSRWRDLVRRAMDGYRLDHGP